MKYFIQLRLAFRRLLRKEDGASAIEYTVIAGLVALALITAAKPVSGHISTIFGNISTSLEEVATGGEGGETDG